ncbi:MAG: hypothetical protein E6J87_02125 [Deltaproteobacteria bacterium]|nr:MAG: hypothetical protein E6J87_02125 [Deltaproteobacteria bacterium]
MRRYAKMGGSFTWWHGRSVHELTAADVRRWYVEDLGRRSIGLKTQKNIADAFRAFLRQLKADEVIERVPTFPEINPPKPVRDTLTIDTQSRVIAAIPWEARGVFLLAAYHALRLGEIRALDISDFDGEKIHLTRATKSQRVAGPVGRLKNDNPRELEIWSDELHQWLRWRMEQATAEARLRGEVALCLNPRADREDNPAMRWSPSALRRAWKAACTEAGVTISFQEGTRHSTLTKLAGELTERALRSFSGHRSGKALDAYTGNVRTDPKAIRKILRRQKLK